MLTKRCGFPIIVSAKAHDMQKHKVYTRIEKCSDQRRSNACNPGSKANLSSNVNGCRRSTKRCVRKAGSVKELQRVGKTK